jgi:23S rRNA (pseudouridine1915-N3)-methyltransferase
MKLLCCSIGKVNEPYVAEGIEQFSKRIRHYFPIEWQLIPTPKQAANLDETELKKQEAALILKVLKPDDWLILLDERGQIWDSPGLANQIQQRANEGTKQVVFLIGGAFGVDEQIRSRANQIWSLSKLVFPHQLVRLMLSEQIYRACTIIRNEKYHHS